MQQNEQLLDSLKCNHSSTRKGLTPSPATGQRSIAQGGSSQSETLILAETNALSKLSKRNEIAIILFQLLFLCLCVRVDHTQKKRKGKARRAALTVDSQQQTQKMSVVSLLALTSADGVPDSDHEDEQVIDVPATCEQLVLAKRRFKALANLGQLKRTRLLVLDENQLSSLLFEHTVPHLLVLSAVRNRLHAVSLVRQFALFRPNSSARARTRALLGLHLASFHLRCLRSDFVWRHKCPRLLFDLFA